MACNPGNPLVAMGLLLLAALALILVLFLGLCVLALFAPLILLLAGLFVLVAGPRFGLGGTARLAAGFGLIIIGALWLGLTW